MKSLLERTMLIAISGNVYPKMSRCDLFIDPPGLSSFTGFDVKRINEIFEVGYLYAKTMFDTDSELKNRLLAKGH